MAGVGISRWRPSGTIRTTSGASERTYQVPTTLEMGLESSAVEHSIVLVGMAEGNGDDVGDVESGHNSCQALGGVDRWR